MSTDAHSDDSNLLAAYVEDRLSEQERQLVTKHLVGCEACRATLAAMARSSEDLSAALPVQTPAIVVKPKRVWGIRPIAWLPVAAGLVIAAVSGVLLVRMGEPPAGGSRAQPGAVQSPTSPTRDQNLPSTSMPSPTSPGAAPRSGDPSSVDPGLLPKRGGEQRVGDKTFRLVAGEWIDSTYDSVAALPEIRTTTPEETTLLIRRVPALQPYATLGSHVLVVLDGTVYRLRGAPAR